MIFTNLHSREIDPELTPNEELGVTEDTTLRDWNRILMAEILSLRSQISNLQGSNSSLSSNDKIQACDINAGVSAVESFSNVAAEAIDSSIMVKTTKTATGIELEWDLTDFENSIPGDLNLRKVSILGDTGKTLAFKASSTNEVRRVDAGNLPLRLEVSATVSGDGGTSVFTTTREIGLEDIEATKVQLNRGTVGPVTEVELSQEDFNKDILDRVVRVESKLG